MNDVVLAIFCGVMALGMFGLIAFAMWLESKH